MDIKKENSKTLKHRDLNALENSGLTSQVERTAIGESTHIIKKSVAFDENPWRDVAHELNVFLVEIAELLEENLRIREAKVSDIADRYHEHEGEATTLFLMKLRSLVADKPKDPEPFAETIRSAHGMLEYINCEYREK